MKVIDTEAHFYTKEYIDYIRNRTQFPKEVHYEDGIKLWYTENFWAPRSFLLENTVLEMGEKRIAEMDNDGIDMQVISLTNPGVQFFEASDGVTWAKRMNDALAAAIEKYPDRFIGLAAVAPQSPAEAAQEIERSIKEIGLKGVVVQSHAQNEYLDDKKFWPLFQKAEELDVPIYIHPTVPATSILEPYAKYGFPLAGPILGFAADVSLHVMRLIYSGLFDAFPKLKIILGHLGEGLPFWFSRIDFYWQKKWVGKAPAIKRKPSDYIKTNFTITTSGMFYQPALLCALLAMGADKIAFAVDYPYEDNKEAVQFMREAPIADNDKKKICHSNAEGLFKI